MRLRKLTALASAFLLTFGVASTVLATAPTGHQVTICHATDSNPHPYVTETVDIASSGDLQGGHSKHTGPLWDGQVKKWGDIIPPYDYTNDSGTFHFDGLNWTEDGQAIYNNGCKVPEEAPHNPAIHVAKSPSTDTLPAGGGDVTYTYVVTNTGDVPLSNVTVSDNKCSPVAYQSGDTNDDQLLDLTESWTFTCSTTLTDTTTNTATATGHDGDTTVTDTDDATVTVQPPADAPAISIDKTADPTTLPAGGGDVMYTYVVKNSGNVPIFDVAVNDDNGTPGDTSDDFTVTCPKDALDVGESMTCTASVTGITVDTTNIGTASADWDSCHDDCKTAVTPATDDATVTVEPVVPPNNAGIHVEKTASVENLPVGGGSVTYTYVVTNTGDIPLTDIAVTDDKCSPVAYDSGDTNDDQILDKTETWTYTCTTTITATTTNTAVATGHDGETTVTDTDNATVPVATSGGGVQDETNVPTPPSTDIASGNVTSSASGSIPFMLIILGVVGLAAVALTPVRKGR